MRPSYVPEWVVVKAKELPRVLEEAGTPVVVTAHRNADPDALASALAMRHVLRELGFDARLVLPEGMSQPSKRLVREVLGVEPSKVEDEAPEESAAAVVVDTASPEQLGPLREFVEGIELLVVVDHHESNRLVSRARLAFYDPTARATSEIVYMLARWGLGVRLPRELLTLLLAGIVYDTRHLVLASPRTLRLAADLMDEGADMQQALKALQSPPMDVPERIARLKAASRMQIIRADKYLVAVTRVGAYESSAARALLDLGADAALVVSERPGEVRVIGRARRSFTEGLGIHLGKDLMEEVARRLGEGGGGGHAQAAGASIRGASVEEVIDKVIEVVREKLREKGLEPQMVS